MKKSDLYILNVKMIESFYEDKIRNLSQQIYEDRKLLYQNGLINTSALDEEQKRDLYIKEYDIKRRIENNERVRDILNKGCYAKQIVKERLDYLNSINRSDIMTDYRSKETNEEISKLSSMLKMFESFETE